ncbi:MAG: Eco57I restriction-modification methylase domain-containing protein [Bacteroidaceae bacterium]|nr:Eco57I restriction-modification methylase domain-containing protein [Bacteroidaceae bacterium]
MVNDYNPDVLNCIANLSNDEVFTPPELANRMLDLLPQALFRSPKTTFLDPFTKSGVFLREIVKRLDRGLQDQIPDRQQRIDHILHHQVFGIACTELTSLLARRSVYCSKAANSPYSVSKFDTPAGNILYRNIRHTWVNGKCRYCGASQSVYDRGSEAEQYAYQFIHTDNPKQFFPNMKFDVIIGNPPYQLSDGGAQASASPLYQMFVEQAKRIKARYISMIIPSRWFGGGKGLDNFRKDTLNDNRFRVIVDYENANDCFPGVDIAGGVCFFLWDRDNKGICRVVNICNGQKVETMRKLNEFETFIRRKEALNIIRKVLSRKEALMADIVSSSKPFGLRTFVRPQPTGDILLRWQNGEGPYNRSEIVVGVEMIDKWKVITSYVGYDHAGNPGKDGKRRVFAKIDVLPPGTICNETYLVINSFNTEKEAKNMVGYMKTLFFRFLVSQLMFSHHITKTAYQFVPVQDFSHPWTDEMLYEKYGLTEEEIAFIESMIRPME